MKVVKKWRYRIDEFFAQGHLNLAVVPAVLAFLFLLGVTGMVYAFHVQPKGKGFGQLLWMGLLRMLDPGTMGNDEGSVFFLGAMLVITLGGIFLISVLIGVVGAWLETYLDKLRKGRSFVPEQDHLLIFGWSPQILRILHELMDAAPGHRQKVVILAAQDKAMMDDFLLERLPKKRRKKHLKIVCRSGNPMDVHDVRRVNPAEARAVIILSDRSMDLPDVYVVKVIMSLYQATHKRVPIIAPVLQVESAHLLRELNDDHNIYPVVIQDVIARIMAQTALQPGLSYIYEELLNFAGDEIYYLQAKPKAYSWRDVALSYETAVPIGLRRGAEILLNPAHDEIIRPEDEIIAIGADQDAIRPDGKPAPLIRSEFFSERALGPKKPRRVLFLGWNQKAPLILGYILQYLPPKSTVLVVTSQRVEAEERLKALREAGRDVLKFANGDLVQRSTLGDLHPERYDHVVVLSDDTVDIQHADARTLMILLHLRDIMRHDTTPFTLVTEMRDMHNRDLAEITKVNDFIVSDHLASLMMTQLAFNPHLAELYDELFAPQGAEVYLKPIEGYVQTEVPVNFYTLTASAMHYHETALGYRLAHESDDAAKNFGIHLNPPKSETVVFHPGDALVVLAED